MVAMLLSAVGIIITIAVLAAVIYLGNSKIANIAEINAQLKSLDQEILRAEVATDHPPGTAVLSYCDDLAEPESVFRLLDGLAEQFSPAGK